MASATPLRHSGDDDWHDTGWRMTGSMDDVATITGAVTARPTLRIVWRTDAEGRFVDAQPPFATFLRMPVHQTGREFTALMTEAGADTEGALAAALAGRTTFSRLRNFWPAADGNGHVSLEWGGVPQRDQSGVFDGFRGFVVVKDRLRPATPAPPEMPTLAPPRPDEVAERPHNVVPLRPTTPDAPAVPVLRRAENAAALSDEERGALAEIAAYLGPPLSPEEERVRASATPAPAAELSGDNLRRIVDLVPIGILVSRDGFVVFANRTLLDLTGFADADALHAAGGLERLFGSRDPAQTDAGGAPMQLRTRDGDTIPVDARVHSVSWDGLPATLLSLRSAVDRVAASRTKELETRLRERDGEARELHTILDTATDGIVILDPDNGILSLNRSAEALFGCDGADVSGQPFETLVADESRGVLADYLAGLKAGGVASVLNDGREILCKDPRGGLIPVFVTLGRVGSDAAPKFCAVLRDLTAWKNAEQGLTKARTEAERASADKSEFLARISHEVRTPLNAILGFAEVMMDERFGPIGNDRYRDYMKDIHRSGEHVMSLVNDLLDLSKIEAGKMDMTFTAVDANACVSDCVALMQPQASRARVVIRLSLAPRLPKIVADDRAMKQIVLNILSNAVKYNESGGQVIVSTAHTDAGHAVVRIRDTGLGMTDSEMQTALEPFGQVQTSRHTTGTGLGLPLTKALVEANRANFTIKSRKGEGTLVEIAFPPSRVMAE